MTRKKIEHKKTLNKVNLKGFKVTDVDRKKLIGIASSSLEDIIIKGSKKLNIKSGGEVTVHLNDGTHVDSEEYFDTLPSHTVLIFKKPGENIITGADLIYNVLKHANIDVLRAAGQVQQFFDDKIKEKLRVLSSVVENLEESSDRTLCSSREEDPDWFAGLETNAKTKESFMFRRSQDRIRGYLYKSQSDLKKNPEVLNNASVLKVVEVSFSAFKDLLRKDAYFGCYLDRSETGAMCNKEGEFACAGVWKNGKCLYEGRRMHLINPYSSREARIIFSTWNLDHCIERSRTILPSLLWASKEVALTCNKQQAVNNSYFYNLLFTAANLRLVHIVCHDKGKHDTANCDKDKLIVPL
ncbi:DNA fragmentation factor subunit beta isoform X2 [Nilaparvata lugens]|uniref:DNA fragmentation factor subunit beta isoform X2 n=1 Tax=Nilaparvata lugens TaxID=108931 RepID=UPI00193CB7A9|nr:DNA fragmentation factor subunit beta isoform X2 [Nilaparvata lugens]